MGKDTKVYFPGLNGLRFFAAAAVIITHVELMKKYLGFNHLWFNPETNISTFAFDHIMRGEIHPANPIVAGAGPLGVVFFFVLSGFLITYLLLVEREKTGTIAVGKFYLRRIFRIWPLYFLIFGLGFFVLPQLDWFQVPHQNRFLENNFWGNFWCYLLILPNLAVAIFGGRSVPNIGQSWSIGVEEQFYLVWPVIVKFFKKPLHAIILVTVVLLLAKATVLTLSDFYDYEWLLAIKRFLAMTKIECMTIGALGAWLIHNKESAFIESIHRKSSQIVAYCGVFALIYFSPKRLQDAVHIIHGIFFLIIIMNVSGNPKSFIKLENKVMNTLGKISYGIYMYHMMIVVFVIYLTAYAFDLSPSVNKDFGIAGNIMIYGLSITLTVLVSWLSYTLLEHRFIKIKSRFSKIKSGEEARDSS